MLSEETEYIKTGITEITFSEVLNMPPPLPGLKPIKTQIEDEPIFFVAAMEIPYPVGGRSSIQQQINYPENPKRAGT